MELFWTFTITVLIVLALVLAIRQRALGWAWNFLVITVVLFAACFKLTGTPRDPWLFATIENLHGDMEVLHHVVMPNKFIYLLIRQDTSQQPYYLRLTWNQGLERDMDAAAMQAKEQQTALMVDIDALSLWTKPEPKPKPAQGKQGGNDPGDGNGADGDRKEGGATMFHPRPVQADPLKTPVHNPVHIDPPR